MKKKSYFGGQTENVNVHDKGIMYDLRSMYPRIDWDKPNKGRLDLPMPRTKQNIPANENEAQRFVRLANARVNSLLTSFKSLGQLRGANYKSTPEQRKKIKEVLQESLNKSVAAMESGEASQEFKL